MAEGGTCQAQDVPKPRQGLGGPDGKMSFSSTGAGTTEVSMER